MPGSYWIEVVVSIGVDIVVVVTVRRARQIFAKVPERDVSTFQITTGVVSKVLPLKEKVNFSERRSLAFVALPALVHQVSHFARTLERGGKTDPVSGSTFCFVEPRQVCDDSFVAQ